MDWGDIFEVAATVLGAYDRYESNQQKKEEARDAARAAEKQAALDEQKRVDALRLGTMEAEKISRRKRAYLGKQKAAMGASGVVAGTGTFADVIEDTESSFLEDENTAIQNAMREAWGYEESAKQNRARASSYKDSADSYGAASWITGLGSIASGTYDFGIEKGWWQK